MSVAITEDNVWASHIATNGVNFNPNMTKAEELAIRIGLALRSVYGNVAFLIQPTVIDSSEKKCKSAADEPGRRLTRLSLTIVEELSLTKQCNIVEYIEENLSLGDVSIDVLQVSGTGWRPVIEMQQYKDGKIVRCFASHLQLFEAATLPVKAEELQKWWCESMLRCFIVQQKIDTFLVTPEQIIEAYEQMPSPQVCMVTTDQSSLLGSRKTVEWCAAQIAVAKQLDFKHVSNCATGFDTFLHNEYQANQFVNRKEHARRLLQSNPLSEALTIVQNWVDQMCC